MPSSRQEGLSYKSRVMARKKAEPNALVASARNMAKLPSRAIRTAMKAEGWQPEAWNYFDSVGEYRYSVSWVGNALSKARLTILQDDKPTTNPLALEALAGLFGGPDGQAEMFRQIGMHLTVAGEGYIIGDAGDSGGDEWLVAPACDLKETTKGYSLGPMVFNDALVIRLWKPHPRNPLSSDCPTRAVLPILAEIDGLTKHVAAQIDSRLASAGILVVPSEISFGSGPTSETEGEGEEAKTSTTQQNADGFVQELIRVASQAIADRSASSALVPIVLQVAGEWVDKIQHLTFWSELDKEAVNLRNEAIRRLALGMDMPPEVLEGTAEMNHWASWQVEEAAIKSHTEPLLAIVVSSLTTGYLRPFLESGMSEEEAATFSFGYDDSKMRLRPNKSAEAIELNDRGILSYEAVLRENGFEASDMMKKEELQLWLLRKVASGSATPEMVHAALKQLGAVLEIEAATVAPAKGEEPNESRPDPSLEEHPRRELPEQVDPAAAAASLLVYRALERAGNRLRTKMDGKIDGVSAVDTYRYVPIETKTLGFLLTDAWDAVDVVAPQLGIDAEVFKGHLDTYTRSLLMEQKTHAPELFAPYLRLMREPAAA